MTRNQAWTTLLLAGALAGAGLTVRPSTAHAQEFRVAALGGAAHFPLRSQVATEWQPTGRLEVTVGSLFWLHLGAYGEIMADVNAGNVAPSYGGLLTFRPRIPIIPVHPMGFVSVGYFNLPAGGNTVTSGWDAQLGAGVVLNATSFLDIEARAALIQLFTRDDAAVGSTGYSFTAGVSLHL